MFNKKQQDQDSDTDGFFQRLRRGLNRTRSGLLASLGDIGSGQSLEPATMEEIETALLMADVGMESTIKIMQALEAEIKNAGRNVGQDQITACLKQQMLEILEPVQAPIEEIFVIKKPLVILVVGVNGVGKTTTIGKMTRYFSLLGDKVMLAAGDTFRAAAIDQIKVWGERNQAPVIAHKSGSDSAAVIFDALQSARAKESDIVIADTAGRLHNKENLMEELRKIRRTIDKFDNELDVEVLLVLDAGTGQNAMSQVELFNEAVGVTGLALTKLDGTARGGVIFALAEKFRVPVRFVGVGEQAEDFRAFHAADFVEAMLDTES